MLSFS